MLQLPLVSARSTASRPARYEHTTIGADFETSQALDLPGYDVLVPSLNMARKLANHNLLKAAYTRRIQRPSLQFLNPNLQALNPLSMTLDNLLLRPDNNYELAYTTTLKGATLNFGTFARTTSGSIQALSQARGDTVRTSYGNIGRGNAFGGSLDVNVNLGQKVILSDNADAYYSRLTNNVLLEEEPLKALGAKKGAYPPFMIARIPAYESAMDNCLEADESEPLLQGERTNAMRILATTVPAQAPAALSFPSGSHGLATG